MMLFAHVCGFLHFVFNKKKMNTILQFAYYFLSFFVFSYFPYYSQYYYSFPLQTSPVWQNPGALSQRRMHFVIHFSCVWFPALHPACQSARTTSDLDKSIPPPAKSCPVQYSHWGIVHDAAVTLLFLLFLFGSLCPLAPP